MTLLVVGLSHRTTSFDVLERVSLDTDTAGKVALDLCSTRVDAEAPVTEAVVLSTCNRVEVYAQVTRFHSAVEAIVRLLSRHTGVSEQQLVGEAYVHYDERAVTHLFSLACGLDSVAVGEAQILGQVRQALIRAQEIGTVGPVLSAAFRSGLHVAKRAHAETGIDAAAPSLVDLALDRAVDIDVAEASALVVGAGSMAAVAVSALQRAGTRTVSVANRSAAAAARLVTSLGDRAGQAWSLSDATAALAEADLVICCTGAPAAVVTRTSVQTAMARRGGRPQVYLDLALPRDVEEGVEDLPGVRVVDLAMLASERCDAPVAAVAAELEPVRAMVAEEVSVFRGWERARAVAPTVSALRAHAEEVVAAELRRLQGRTAGMSDDHRDEVVRTVRRVVDKLLHRPTVRLRQSAEAGDADYAAAVRSLFDLDPARVAALSAVDELCFPGAEER